MQQNRITLGDDEYFVLGDNRNTQILTAGVPSVGVLHRKDLIGRAWVTDLWPFSDIGFIRHD